MDLYGLCRLCMRVTGKLHDLFDSQECRDRQLPSKLKMCTPLQINENDILPKGICEDCIKKVEKFYSFINTCVQTESLLSNCNVNLTDSDQLKCRKQVYVQQYIENNSNDEPPSPKKSIGSDPSSVLTIQSISNLVQSGSLQHIKTSTIDEVESTERNDTMGNYSNQSVRTHESGGKKTTENVETIDCTVPGTSNSAQEDNEKNIFSSDCVNPLTVEPATLHFEFNKTGINDHNNSKYNSDDENIHNWLLPTNIAISCTLCGKVLKNKEEIMMHNQTCVAVTTRSVQNVLKSRARDTLLLQFPCEKCEKTFERKEHLIQHFKLHAGERPHNCETCSKSFIRKEHLTRHKLTHTSQQMYKCNYCCKYFNRKDNLYKHHITHGIIGPFFCEICDKSFMSKRFYDMHNATHK